MFRIDVKDMRWIDNAEDDIYDLCLHGFVTAVIGDEVFEYDATVSATGLYLLKTLTEEHIIGESIQMMPCCGHFIIPNDSMDSVTILGCPQGIDWTVLHENDFVKVITESGKETTIDIVEYEKSVFAFADKVEQFYKKCSAKSFYNDFDEKAYTAFCNEWNRRRNNHKEIHNGT